MWGEPTKNAALTFLLHCSYIALSLILHCLFTALILLYNALSMLLHCSFITLSLLLHCSYIALTLLFQCSCTAFTLVVQCSYIALSLLLHCSYISLSLLLHCSYIGLSMLLHCSCTASGNLKENVWMFGSSASRNGSAFYKKELNKVNLLWHSIIFLDFCRRKNSGSFYQTKEMYNKFVSQDILIAGTFTHLVSSLVVKNHHP